MLASLFLSDSNVCTPTSGTSFIAPYPNALPKYLKGLLLTWSGSLLQLPSLSSLSLITAKIQQTWPLCLPYFYFCLLIVPATTNSIYC